MLQLSTLKQVGLFGVLE